MDWITLIGLTIGLIALIGGYLWDGGHLSSLFVPSALLIVVGGTIGAVAVSFPLSRLRDAGRALKLAFMGLPGSPQERIDEITEMAAIARREGVLSLEQRAMNHPDGFLRDGLMMVVDATDPGLTREILELEMEAVERRYEGWAKVFEAAGGYAPTMGIIGTVMGLIHVLGNLTEPGRLGPAIAVAFTATLYGVATANVICLPIASKIKVRSTEQIAEMELMLEGILSLQAGENPQLIRKKLESFLEPDYRADKAGDDGGEEK